MPGPSRTSQRGGSTTPSHSTLRSIRPTCATTSLPASVDHDRGAQRNLASDAISRKVSAPSGHSLMHRIHEHPRAIARSSVVISKESDRLMRKWLAPGTHGGGKEPGPENAPGARLSGRQARGLSSATCPAASARERGIDGAVRRVPSADRRCRESVWGHRDPQRRLPWEPCPCGGWPSSSAPWGLRWT